jgi:selenide,water dikinase
MKRLVLLGGGPTHVEVIRRLGVARPPDTHIVLISADRYTMYSGMLPGFVAGHYHFDDCHIDLQALCQAAHVEFRVSRAQDLDLRTRRVQCSDGAVVAYDLLSINIGATPQADSIAGALEHALPVKPLLRFLESWQEIRRAARAVNTPMTIAMVGAGAGGVELVLALHHRLCVDRDAGARLGFHLLTDAPSILPDHSPRVRRKFERILFERRIAVHVQSRVTRIEAGMLHREHGAPIAVHQTVLATTASAPRWIAASGLRTDARGFVLVSRALHSLSHSDVFSAGDIASLHDGVLPKSGVYAVRQGPPLTENLRRALAGRPLVAYVPQKAALALISTGGQHAVASWRSLAFEGQWVWRWKDRIDRRFVARYRAQTAVKTAS